MKLGTVLLELSQNPELLERFLQELASKATGRVGDLSLTKSFMESLRHPQRDKLLDNLGILLEAEFTCKISNDIFSHIDNVYLSCQKVPLDEGSSVATVRTFTTTGLAQTMKSAFQLNDVPEISGLLPEKAEYDYQDRDLLQKKLEQVFIEKFHKENEKVLMLVLIMPDYHREVYEKVFVHLKEETIDELELPGFGFGRELENRLSFSMLDNEFYCFETSEHCCLHTRVNLTELENGNRFSIGDTSFEFIQAGNYYALVNFENNNMQLKFTKELDPKDREYLVGSSEESNIMINDITIKNKHLEIYFDNKWYLRALDNAEVWKYTTTGPDQMLKIQQKTQIKIGTTVIVFERIL